MIEVIVYKPSPYGLVFIHDKPLGFIIYHTQHARVYVSYKMFKCQCHLILLCLHLYDYFRNLHVIIHINY